MGLFSKIFGKDNRASVESKKELSSEEINAYVKIASLGTSLAFAAKKLRFVSGPTEARKVLREIGEIIENEKLSHLCKLAANEMSDDQLIPICRQLAETIAAQAITALNFSAEGLKKS